MPEKPTRSETFRLRLSPAENTMLRERAQAAGLKLAEYVRRECGVGHFGRADLRRTAQPALPEAEQVGKHVVRGPDHDRRVRDHARRMPQKTAERVVSREESRERARAALGS